MKTILSLAILTLCSTAFADVDCSIKAYQNGQLIKEAKPTLYKNDVSCAALANSIILGTFGLEEGKADLVEFTYLSSTGEIIQGSLKK
jgi:hypothetical protein